MMNHENKNIYNDARRAWLLYIQGIRLQMRYENKDELTDEEQTTLNDIRDYNNKLYEYIKNNE